MMIFKYRTHEQRKLQVAAAVVGGAVIGGVASNMAAGTAANAQEDAANSANALSQSQYNQTRADNAAFLNNGTAASNQLAYRLGLPGATASGSGAPDIRSIISQAVGQSYDQGYRPNTGDNTREDAINGALLNYGNGLYGSAADAYKKFTGTDLPTQSTSQTDPNFGSLTRKFDQNDLNSDVVYQSGLQFGLDQGTQGINRLAAANGSLNSGATLKALTKFGNDYGSTKANDAYNRYTADNTNIYNKLAGISGGGQTAANTVGAAGASNTNALSNTAIGLGNARGASAIAQGNSISNGANSISNYYQQQQMLNQLNSGNYNGYMNNANANGFGTAFRQNGFSSDPAYD